MKSLAETFIIMKSFNLVKNINLPQLHRSPHTTTLLFLKILIRSNKSPNSYSKPVILVFNKHPYSPLRPHNNPLGNKTMILRYVKKKGLSYLYVSFSGLPLTRTQYSMQFKHIQHTSQYQTP